MFRTFSPKYSERGHVLELNQRKMLMSIDQLWKEMLLASETSPKIPKQMGSSSGTLQKQLLQSSLAEGDELSPSP